MTTVGEVIRRHGPTPKNYRVWRIRMRRALRGLVAKGIGEAVAAPVPRAV